MEHFDIISKQQQKRFEVKEFLKDKENLKKLYDFIFGKQEENPLEEINKKYT